MATIHVIDRQGGEHTLEAKPGLSVMEILRDGGLPAEATCGGQCICSTCHIYVDEAWTDKLEPRSAAEQIMVEDTGHFEQTSRLSCQIDFDNDLDGIRLVLAPEF